MTGGLRRNTAGVLVSEVDTDEEIYDSTAACRGRAIDGVLPSATQVRDERSSERSRR